MAKHETTIKLKAENNTERALRTAERDLKKVDRAGDQLTGTLRAIGPALLGAFSIGAFVAFAGRTVAQIRELEGLSAASAIAVEDLRAYGAATRTVGVTLEQFADINKDVNDKLGEFAATGGGGFKDFFDVVPKSIRPTIEELEKLAGPQVLIAVKKAMDAANISGKRQTFVLESIGNDASKLAPLLENAGEEFLKLSEIAKGSQKNLDALERDTLSKTAAAFAEAGEEAKGFAENVLTFVSPLGFLIAKSFTSIVRALDPFDTAEEKLAELIETARDLEAMSALKQNTDGVAFSMRDLAGEVEEVNRQILLLGGKVVGGTEDIAGQLDLAGKFAARLKGEIEDTPLDKAVAMAKEFADEFERALELQEKLQSNIEAIQGIGAERKDKRDPTVGGALTTAGLARIQLQQGNVEKASELALEAARELRAVEEETGEKVTLAGTFIKNFEKIALDALTKAEEVQKALVLEIVVDGVTRQFEATEAGVKQAGKDTSDRIKNAAKRGA
jgi:hypothetical protein